jgi:aminopeptidase N
MCAGQFEVIENQDHTAPVPMKIYLRNSKKDCIDADELFRVIKVGMRFYEEYTGVKYPFEKYDHIFCPEFRIGAMENVGAVTFTDRFLMPKDSLTDFLLLRFHYIALHELAHMWFGDLVTMEWWNDLWLKESFADFMAATNMTENPDLINYKNSDQIFLNFLNNAIEADCLKTTHPISVVV